MSLFYLNLYKKLHVIYIDRQLHFLQFVEQPLELFFLWKINAERKSLVVTDHDPNENR